MDAKGSFLAQMITAARHGYASMAAERQLGEDPGFAEAVTESEIRLDYLCAALATGRIEILLDHIAWLKVSFSGHGVSLDFLARNLECLRDELADGLPPEHAAMAVDFLDRARRHLDEAPNQTPSHLSDGAPQVELARRFLLGALEGRTRDALDLILGALDDGETVESIHTNVLQPAQAEVGRLWQIGDLHTAEEHLTSRIVERACALLAERLPDADSTGRTALIASVTGNLHDIGPRIITNAFERHGWRVINLGANMPGRDVVRAVVEFSADLLALSASMSLQIPATAEMIAELRADEATARIPILVGGHPFVAIDDLWKVVGADGYAADGLDAVATGGRLVAERSA